MRGVPLALALAILVLLHVASASAVVIGVNETYTVASKSFRIEPINTDGLRYIDLADNRTKLWKLRDCMTIEYVRTCLTSASTSSGTFSETFLGAIVKASHSIASSSASLGTEVEGTVTLTNKQPLSAQDVRIRLNLSGPATFRDGSTTRVITGEVGSEWTNTYRVTSNAPGIVTIGGTVSYFDSNTTQLFDLPERKITVSIPFTYTVTYENDTTTEPTELFVEVKRKNANLTMRIDAQFPPQTLFHSIPRAVNDDEQLLWRKTTLLDDTKMNLSASYFFTDAPSEPLVLSFTYRDDDEPEQVYTIEYPFVSFTEGTPSLGVRIDPTPEGEDALVRVLITGNSTGALDLRGKYIDDARIVGPGTYEFIARSAPQGNHTFNLTFSWEDPYGKPFNITGKAVLVITAPRPPTPPEPAAITPPSVVLVTEPLQESIDALVWVVGGLAAACLGGLAYVLLSLRNPVHRVEHLLRKAAALRKMHAQKRGSWTEEEQARLAALEEELARIQKKL